MATVGADESGMRTTRRPLPSRNRSTGKVGAGGRLVPRGRGGVPRAIVLVGMAANLTRTIAQVTSAVPQPLPVFVYGTLRPGEVNWEHRLEGRVVDAVPARLDGVALVDCGPYPAAVERPGAPGVAGDLLWVEPALWGRTVELLDELEGYVPGDRDNLFERVVRAVVTGAGTVDAWVYLAGHELAAADVPEVPGGDWVAYRAASGEG